MTFPSQLPAWLIAVLASAFLVGCVGRNLHLRFCSYHQSRWVVASLLGAVLASALAPSPWIAAFLVCIALGNVLSISSFYRLRTVGLAHPPMANSTLVMLSLWVVALGILAAALRSTGPEVLLAGLLGAAAYSTAVGGLQVIRGLSSIRCQDAAFGEIGSIVRQPCAYLHNAWKVSAINAMVVPIAVSLALVRSWWAIPLLLLALGILWQLWYVGSLTCIAAAVAGLAAVLALSGHLLAVSVTAPLALVAYPATRRQLLGDPRWEAWTIAWRLLRRNRLRGMGLGAWPAFQVQTPKEGERIWMFLHNDWLESVLECGPLPALCALGYLGAAAIRASGGLSPTQAGLFGSLVVLAVLALGYMPWRVWPVNLFGLAILASWEAA